MYEAANMRTWKTTATTQNEPWRRAYSDAISEVKLSARLEKIAFARTAILDEIEHALHSGHSHPSSKELRLALRVLDAMSAPEPSDDRNFRTSR